MHGICLWMDPGALDGICAGSLSDLTGSWVPLSSQPQPVFPVSAMRACICNQVLKQLKGPLM